MKEGGVPASEAANAIKNSLGRIINPTKAAQERMMAFGINLKEIVSSNAGNLIGMLTELQDKLDGLTNLQRSQAISEIFGKYQFARMTAFFDNFNKAGTQSAKVMQMMGMSSKQLEEVAKRQEELIQQSASGKFQIALQQAQQALLPLGASFLSAFTDVLNMVNKVVSFLDKLPDSAKSFLKFGMAATIIIGPLVMATGLFANFFGTIAKGLINFRIFSNAIRMGQNPIKALTESYRVLTPSIVATERAAAVFGTSMGTVAGASQAATRAITAQITALQNLQAALSRIPATGVAPPPRGAPAAPPPRRRSGGTPSRMPGETGQLPGYGGGDVIPALLEPGEFVVNKVSTKQNLSLLHDINQGRVRKRMSGTPDGSPGETMDDVTRRSTRMGIESVLTPQEKELESILTGKQKQPRGIRTSSPKSDKTEKTGVSGVRSSSPGKEKGKKLSLIASDAHVGDQSKIIRGIFESLPDNEKEIFLKTIQERFNDEVRDRQGRILVPRNGINAENFDRYLKFITYGWTGQTIQNYPGAINNILNGITNINDSMLEERLQYAKDKYESSLLAPGKQAKLFDSIDEARKLAAQGAPFDVDSVEKLYHYGQALTDRKEEGIEKQKRITSVNRLLPEQLKSLVEFDENGQLKMSSKSLEIISSHAGSSKNIHERNMLMGVQSLIAAGAPQDVISSFIEKEQIRGGTTGRYQGFFLPPGSSNNAAGANRSPKNLLKRMSFNPQTHVFPGMIGGQFHPYSTFGYEKDIPISFVQPGSNLNPISSTVAPPFQQPTAMDTPAKTHIFYGGSSFRRMSPLGWMIPRLMRAGGGITPTAAQFLGAIRGIGSVQKARELRDLLSRSNVAATTGRFANMPVTQLGERTSSIGGMSSAIPGINGVYNIGNGKFVVKVHDTPESALAEVRGTQLTRDIFGLVTPNQQLIKIKHPVTGDEMFAVASPYDKRFAATTGKIGEDKFYDQALASVIRRDKDLQPDNLYDDIVTDVGSAYVANKASQPRVIGGEMPSVREQIETNFLMVKGGAKKWFAESTAGIASKTTAEKYEAGFKAAIARAESRAQKAIDDLPYLTPEERKMYMRLIDDLKEARMVDWKSVHAFHKDIVPEVKKPPTAAALAKKEAAEAQKQRESGSMAPWDYGMPFYFSGGGKIPGFGGGDIVPAMVEPGEFVVNKDQSKKFAPLLHAINSGNYQKLNNGTKKTSGGGWEGSPGSWRPEEHPGNPNSPTPPPPAPPKSRSERMKEGWANAQNVGRQMARNFSDGISKSFSKEGAKEMARGAGRIGKDLAVGAVTRIAAGIDSRAARREAERERIRNMTPEQRQAYNAEKEAARQERKAERQLRSQRFQGVGMAAMMGSGTIMQMTGGGTPALNYGLMGAGMGSMFGPWGLAIGASLGILGGALQSSVEQMNKETEARRVLLESIHKSAAGLTNLEQEFSNVRITQLVDIDTSMLDSALVNSTSQLESFTEAIKNAEQGTVESARRQAFEKSSTAEELMQTPAFNSLINQALGSGMKQEKLNQMIYAYLKASEKQDFMPQIENYLKQQVFATGGKFKFEDASGVRRSYNPGKSKEYAEQVDKSLKALDSVGITKEKAVVYSEAQSKYNRMIADQGAISTDEGERTSVMTLLDDPTLLQGLMSMYLSAQTGEGVTTKGMGTMPIAGPLASEITGIQIGGQDILENPEQFTDYINKLVKEVIIPTVGKEGLAAMLGSLGTGDALGATTFKDALMNYLATDPEVKARASASGGTTKNFMGDGGQEVAGTVQVAAQLAQEYEITPEMIQLQSDRALSNVNSMTFDNSIGGRSTYVQNFLREVGLGNIQSEASQTEMFQALEEISNAMENFKVTQEMLSAAMGDQTKDALSNLNQFLKGFEQGLSDASTSTKDTFQQNIQNVLTEIGGKAPQTFNDLVEKTGSWREALMGLKIVLSDVGYSLEDLNNMSDIQIKTIINRVERSTTEELPATTLPSADELAAREAAAASSSGGSSGGGAPDTSAIDKQIEALQKKIDNIRTEREEVAKLNAEYQKNLEYQKRRLDIENQMREALAAGNLLQYAQLQQEKQVMETQKAAEDAQAKGDKEAENRIKDLEKKIEKLQKQKSDMSSGGGGGGGGGSSASEEKPKPPYDVAGITASLGALAVPFESAQAFIKSDVVQPYIKMLKELGYTNDEVTKEIAYQWSVARQSIVDDYSNLKETQKETMDYLTSESIKFRSYTDEAKQGVVQLLTSIMIDPTNSKESALEKFKKVLDQIGISGKKAERVARQIYQYGVQNNDGGPIDVTKDIAETSKQVDKFINGVLGDFDVNKNTQNKITQGITQVYSEALRSGDVKAEFGENAKSKLIDILVPDNLPAEARTKIIDQIDTVFEEQFEYIKNWPLENTDAITRAKNALKDIDFGQILQDAIASTNKSAKNGGMGSQFGGMTDILPDEEDIKEYGKFFINTFSKNVDSMGQNGALKNAAEMLKQRLIKDGMDPESAARAASRMWATVKSVIEGKDPVTIKTTEGMGGSSETDLYGQGGSYVGSTFVKNPVPQEQKASSLLSSVIQSGAMKVYVTNPQWVAGGGVAAGGTSGVVIPNTANVYVGNSGAGSGPGGPTMDFAGGGPISGPGTWTSDSIPAMLSNGEYVVKSSSVAKYGQGMMDAINAGKYAKGGPVGYMNGGAVGFAEGGAVSGTSAFVNVIVSGVTAGTTWMNSMAQGMSAAAGVVQEALSNSIKFGEPEGIKSGQDWIAGLAKAIDSGAMRVYLSFQTILTGIKTRVQNTSVQIMAILEETLGKGYTFDIIGKPKMLISEGTVSIWQKVMGETYAALVNAGEVQQYHMGGQVLPPEFRTGNVFNRTGAVRGPGGPTEDKIPAMLSDGEFVVRASSVKAYGLETLNALNEGTLSFAKGGPIRKFAEGGIAKLFTGSPLGEDIANWSRQFEGTPYNSGGYWQDGPVNGWGCATMTQWLYNNRFGLNLPDPSMSGQQMIGNPNVIPEDMSKWLPGDLLYFYYKNGVNTDQPANHTGMYLGGGSMIHAQGDGIGNETNITGIASGLVGVRRMLPPTDAGFQWPMQSFHNGGMSVGPGGPMDDKIPAMLSNGEFVVRASAVRSYGVDFMRALNQGLLNPAVLKMAANKTFSAPSFNDTMVNASDANVVSINNEFNITGDDPKAIANEVVKVLNTQQRKVKSRSRI